MHLLVPYPYFFFNANHITSWKFLKFTFWLSDILTLFSCSSEEQGTIFNPQREKNLKASKEREYPGRNMESILIMEAEKVEKGPLSNKSPGNCCF